MNIGNLIFTLPTWQKTLVRKTENENKKIANTESSLVYNTTCLKENLLTNYTNIYIYTYIYIYQSFVETIIERFLPLCRFLTSL